MEDSSKDPTSSTIHGEVFSLKLIMLFLIRGIKAGYRFQLGMELEKIAGKFDDFISEYVDDNGNIKRRCIQAKHRLDGKGTITFKQFISDGTGNFSLPKYFRSYMENIKSSQTLDEIDDLVICTNYNVEKELETHLTPLNKEDKIFGYEDQSGKWPTKRYKIINEDSSPLKECLIGSCGPINSLAKKLFDCAKNKTQMNEKDAIFKDYHVTLIKEKVVDKTTKRFHQEFAIGALNLTEDARRLHQVIVNMSKSSGISDLWEKELKLKTHFGISGSGGNNKIPNYSESETDIDDFLSKFVLAVTPHETNMDEILEKELCDYFNDDRRGEQKKLLSNQDLQSSDFFVKMLNWFKKKKVKDEDSWMTSTEGEKILENIDDKIECFRIGSISLEFRKEILNIIKFHHDEIGIMKQKLMNLFDQLEVKKYYEIQSPSSVLFSANKVISALKTMDDYQADDSYLVVSAKRLQEDIDGRWKKAFLHKDCHHLLVVVCEDNNLDDQGNKFDFSTWIGSMSSQKAEKKKLLIVKKGSAKNNEDENNVCVEDSIAYEQLSDETKKNLLSKTFLFQGVEKSISDLIANDVSDNQIFNSDTLIELLFNKQKVEIPSQHFTQTSRFEKNKYIERQLRRWIWPKDTPFWTKVAEKLKCSINQLESECQWDKTSSRIHWIVKDNERISKIMKAISETNSEMSSSFFTKLNEDKLIETKTTQGQVTVISGVAGTGKSFTLSHFYEKIKELKPNHWVVAFNLMNYCKALSQIDNSKMNDTDNLIKFLTKHFAKVISTNNSSCFAQSLLTQRLKENGNITFLLDGFDEISSELQKTTISFTKALINLTKVDHVFITTRPHMNETLQDAFHQFVCNLELLEKNDQCSLIVDSWKRKLDARLHNEKYMQQFASNLVDQISKSLKDEDKKFIGVPLQCHILAGCFQHSLEEALEKNETVESLIGKCTLQDLDLAGLYKRLIKEKLTIYNRDKIMTNEVNNHFFSSAIKNQMTKYLTKLAVSTILETTEDADILLNRSSYYSFCESKKKQRDEDNNNMNLGVDIGLLDRNGDKVDFLHRTYAEYLVADYIFQGFQVNDDSHNGILQSKSIRNLLVKKIFKNDLYEGVVRFLNCMLKSFGDESNDWRRLMNQLVAPPYRLKFMAGEICYAEKFETDENRTLLAIAFRRNFPNIFILICDCLKMFFDFDLEQLQSAFGDVFKNYIDSSISVNSKISSAIFQRLLSIYYTKCPNEISITISKKLDKTFRYALSRRNCNNEEMKQTVTLALEFLFKHEIRPYVDIYSNQNYDYTNSLRYGKGRNGSSVLQYFIIDDYYDSVLPTLLDHLLLLDNDTFLDVVASAFRGNYFKPNWAKRGRNEITLKRIVSFLRANKRPILANGLFREILLLGDEEMINDLKSTHDVFDTSNPNTNLHRAAFYNELQVNMDNIFLIHSDESTIITEVLMDNLTPFYIAAARGNEEMCCKILNYLKKHNRYYNDCKSFLFDTLVDAILFRKIEMFRVVLTAIKKTFGQDNLKDFLLHSDISDVVKPNWRDGKPNRMFVLVKDEAMFNVMIGMLIDGDSSTLIRESELLNNLFLENEWTWDKIEFLNDEHFRLLVPIEEIEGWLKSVMNKNINTGFPLLSYCIHRLDRLQHEQIIRIITETENDDKRISYWGKWLRAETNFREMIEKKECIKKFCKSISTTLGEETLIDDVLLHDKGYGIVWSMRIGNNVFESVIDTLSKANQEMFANKFIEFLPDVIKKADSEQDPSKVRKDWIEKIFHIAKYADENHLSKFVEIILEKTKTRNSIWNNRTDVVRGSIIFNSISNNIDFLPRSEINSFLGLVSTKLGNNSSQLDQLIFHDDCEWLAKCAQDPKYHKDLETLMSNLDDQIRAKVFSDFITKLINDLKQSISSYSDEFIRKGLALSNEEELRMREFVEYELNKFIAPFPLLVKYSADESDLRNFIDTLLTIKFPGNERSIWAEYFCDNVEVYYSVLNDWRYESDRKEKQERLVAFLKSVREKLKSKYLEKLIFHEDGRIITRFLLWANEKLVDPILNDLPIELHKKIAKCLIDNTLKEFLDPENSLSLEQGRINTSFFRFLKFHVDNETIVKLIIECNPSIWINHLRGSVKGNKVDSVMALVSVLLQNVNNEGVDSKQLLTNLRHQAIDVILHNINIRNPNWFAVLLQLPKYADNEQLSKLIETITRCTYPENVDRKYSLWSYFIYYSDDEKKMSRNVKKFLECVRDKLGSSKVKELVLHSPNEADDPVVVRADLNGENDRVETMLYYVSKEDREEIRELLEKAQNQIFSSS